ncbi:MAG TPA: hypothetical protein VFD50_03190 [Thermoleophilia bacterium]|nr:hypothetical protein [Thermoleophilia bacterium]
MVIAGTHFKVSGKSVVKKVMFDTKRATRVSVTSATSITATVPAGKGRVNVRVVTKAGGKSARVAADKYTYLVATQIALNAGDGQSASAGTAVSTAPSVIVRDAASRAVAGAKVTFAVATGGGSVTDASTMTDASGIAKVGSWKLGTTAGANTLTATSAGLTGSPVTFTATGNAGVLQVKLSDVPVRSYSLDELKALTPFAGFAGYKSKGGTVYGPDAVTGVSVTDVVKDALGTPLAASQSVIVAQASPFFGGTFSYLKLTHPENPTTGFAMFDLTGVSTSTFAGKLAPVLVYSDPAGIVMTTAKGPLRFFVADTVSETVMTGSDSVSNVDTLNVITTP